MSRLVTCKEQVRPGSTSSCISRSAVVPLIVGWTWQASAFDGRESSGWCLTKEAAMAAADEFHRETGARWDRIDP